MKKISYIRMRDGLAGVINFQLTQHQLQRLLAFTIQSVGARVPVLSFDDNTPKEKMQSLLNDIVYDLPLDSIEAMYNEAINIIRSDAKIGPDVVIFTDFDGVLIPEKRTNTHWLDPEKMKLLKQLADATGGAIVLTTYWRDYWQQTNTEAGRLIEESFAQAELQIYSKTGHANIREEEIADWMIENRVKAFVVLDDDPGQFFSDLWEKPESLLAV